MLSNTAEALAPLDGPQRREMIPPMNNPEDGDDAVVVEAMHSNVQFSPLKSALKAEEEREAVGLERSLAAVSRLIQRVTDALEVSLGGMQACHIPNLPQQQFPASRCLDMGAERREQLLRVRRYPAVSVKRFQAFFVSPHAMDARFSQTRGTCIPIACIATVPRQGLFNRIAIIFGQRRSCCARRRRVVCTCVAYFNVVCIHSSVYSSI